MLVGRYPNAVAVEVLKNHKSIVILHIPLPAITTFPRRQSSSNVALAEHLFCISSLGKPLEREEMVAEAPTKGHREMILGPLRGGRGR